MRKVDGLSPVTELIDRLLKVENVFIQILQPLLNLNFLNV